MHRPASRYSTWNAPRTAVRHGSHRLFVRRWAWPSPTSRSKRSPGWANLLHSPRVYFMSTDRGFSLRRTDCELQVRVEVAVRSVDVPATSPAPTPPPRGDAHPATATAPDQPPACTSSAPDTTTRTPCDGPGSTRERGRWPIL